MYSPEALREFYFPAIHGKPFELEARQHNTNSTRPDVDLPSRGRGHPKDSTSGIRRAVPSTSVPPEGRSGHHAANIPHPSSDIYLPPNPPRSFCESGVTIAVGEKTGTSESGSSRTLRNSSHLSELAEDGLSALRKQRLDLQYKPSRKCALRSTRCEQERPSCWNHQHGFLEYHDIHDDFHTTQGQYQQPYNIHVEKEVEPLPWLDTLRNHPYVSLDEGGEISQAEKWSMKLRHGRPSTTPRKKRRRIHVDVAVEEEDKEALLPVIDMIDEIPSPVITPPSTPVNHPFRARPTCGPNFTISLDFGRSSRPSSSTQVPSPSKGITLSWTASDAPTYLENDGIGKMKDSLKGIGKLGSKSCSDKRPRSSFHCTFCLKLCQDRQEWEHHEQSDHMLQEEWICMPWGPTEKLDGYDICVFCGAVDPDDSHSSRHQQEPCYSQPTKDRTYPSKKALQEHLRTVHDQTKMTDFMQSWSWPPEDNGWYWACGFCDIMLASWTERVEHIGDHAREGRVMASWDPLTPSNPLDRTTLTCAAWFDSAGWDVREIWALHLKEQKVIRRIHNVEGQPHCQHCDSYFGNEEDLHRHDEIWHHPREIWSCPTMEDVNAAILLPISGPLARFLFPGVQQSTKGDVCPYCSEPFSHNEDWDIRLKHLEIDHQINKCQPACRFFRREHAVYHLAGVHNVEFSDWMAEVVEACRSVQPPLAEMVMPSCPPTTSRTIAKAKDSREPIIGIEA